MPWRIAGKDGIVSTIRNCFTTVFLTNPGQSRHGARQWHYVGHSGLFITSYRAVKKKTIQRYRHLPKDVLVAFVAVRACYSHRRVG